MLKSRRCNLGGASPRKLVRRQEDTEEMGGYFVVNGLERLIRLLLVQRANHVLALTRPSYRNRGADFTEFATSIRCVRSDFSSQSNTLHYISIGDCSLGFAYRKRIFLIPVVLVMRALVDTNDAEIYDAIVQNSDDTFVSERAELMLRRFKTMGLQTRQQCLAYLGSRFHILFDDIANEMTDLQAGHLVLRKFILVHLENYRDRFNLLGFMIRKLFALVSGDCMADNPDSPMNHDVLLSGHLYLLFVKDKLDSMLAMFMALLKSSILNRDQKPFSITNGTLL